MNLYNLINDIVTRMIYTDSIPNAMAKKHNFDFDSLTNIEKEQIKLELMNYLIFCFLSLFQILQIPTAKLEENLKHEEIIDFSFLIGLFLSFYPTNVSYSPTKTNKEDNNIIIQ